jgi:beta-RFAP synthase
VYEKGSAAIDAVRVRAPARLHFGFLDLNGSLGRRFGSLGLTLENPTTDILVVRAPAGAASVKENGRIARTVQAASAFLDVPSGVDVRVEAEIPPHAGFGSGTQLALAIVTGMARLLGRSLDLRRRQVLSIAAIGRASVSPPSVMGDSFSTAAGTRAVSLRPFSAVWTFPKRGACS